MTDPKELINSFCGSVRNMSQEAANAIFTSLDANKNTDEAIEALNACNKEDFNMVVGLLIVTMERTRSVLQAVRDLSQ